VILAIPGLSLTDAGGCCPWTWAALPDKSSDYPTHLPDRAQRCLRNSPCTSAVLNFSSAGLELGFPAGQLDARDSLPDESTLASTAGFMCLLGPSLRDDASRVPRRASMCPEQCADSTAEQPRAQVLRTTVEEAETPDALAEGR